MLAEKLKRIAAAMLVAVMGILLIHPINVQADASNPDNWDWYKYSNNEENNAVTNARTITNYKEADTKWATKVSGVSGWEASATPPLIDGKYAYVAAKSHVRQIDIETGLETELSLKERPAFYKKKDVGYAMNPMLYAEGKFFIPLDGGSIQCVDAKTLEPLWASKPLQGQSISNISYKRINGKGYVYTGTWKSHTKDGTFFAVAIDNEGISEVEFNNIKYKEKEPAWSFVPSSTEVSGGPDNNRARGFYWAGAYVTEKYLAVGTDDGTNDGNYVKGGTLFTLNPVTGAVIDSIPGIKGDIRTSISYNNGYLYFSTKGGHLHKCKVDSEGHLSEDSYVNLGGMTTATPVVYKDRIYIGVCGTGGQFDPNAGHKFVVINGNAMVPNNDNDDANSGAIAYTQPIPGYPQATPLLTTAYENEDYDNNGSPDGRVYVYFTFNAKPGGIYYFYDTPGATAPAITDPNETFLYSPPYEQYCISPINVDKNGVLYFKNDSTYNFAVHRNAAYLDGLELLDNNDNPFKIKEGEEMKEFKDVFSFRKKEYTINYSAETSVKVKPTPVDGGVVTVNGTAYSGTPVEIPLSGQSDTVINVVVKKEDGGKTYSRTYSITMVPLGNSALAEAIYVTEPYNTPPWLDADAICSLTPAFSSDIDSNTEMVSEINEDIRNNSRANVWVTMEDPDSTMKVVKLIKNSDGVIQEEEQELNKINNASSEQEKSTRRIMVSGEQYRDINIKVHITSANGKNTKTYLVTVGNQYHVAKVELKKTDVIIKNNEEISLAYEITPDNADDKSVIWSSDNPDVATVDNDGRVKGKGTGEANITITTLDGNHKDVCHVTVGDVAVKKLKEKLKTDIDAAYSLSTSIAESVDGNDILTSDKWTTKEAFNSLNKAISEAENVYNNPNATAEQIEAAINSLEKAVNDFNATVQNGTKKKTKPATNQSAIIDNVEYAPVYNYDYYVKNNPDILQAFNGDKKATLNHFVHHGMDEGRQACEWFDVYFYKNTYNDLQAVYGDNLRAYYLHYISYGKNEGRKGCEANISSPNMPVVADDMDYSSVYDYDYYVNNNPDIMVAFGGDRKATFNHFINYGMNEGRQACEWFDVNSYKNAYGDLRSVFKNDLKAYYLHFMNYGCDEGRIAIDVPTVTDPISGINGADYSPVYDYNYYLDNNPDIKAAFNGDEEATLNHFIIFGMAEGRIARPEFNVWVYQANYEDLRAAFGSDMKSYYIHYIYYGVNEGRTAQ